MWWFQSIFWQLCDLSLTLTQSVSSSNDGQWVLLAVYTAGCPMWYTCLENKTGRRTFSCIRDVPPSENYTLFILFIVLLRNIIFWIYINVFVLDSSKYINGTLCSIIVVIGLYLRMKVKTKLNTLKTKKLRKNWNET